MPAKIAGHSPPSGSLWIGRGRGNISPKAYFVRLSPSQRTLSATPDHRGNPRQRHRCGVLVVSVSRLCPPPTPQPCQQSPRQWPHDVRRGMPTLCSGIPPQEQLSKRSPPATVSPACHSECSEKSPTKPKFNQQRKPWRNAQPHNRRTSLRTVNTSARGFGWKPSRTKSHEETQQTPRTLPLFGKNADNNCRLSPTQ
jgi:hypothetical protein